LVRRVEVLGLVVHNGCDLLPARRVKGLDFKGFSKRKVPSAIIKYAFSLIRRFVVLVTQVISHLERACLYVKKVLLGFKNAFSDTAQACYAVSLGLIVLAQSYAAI